ncbi:polysaccharide deacetylase family protein [Wansuia hejianensis]|uniref:Polysaccharide deacetylase family protein n=1 Tax=Wansuia hejianensis TaxID=2763667 RepID=A0A926INR4_9FIRM|nr:polysaccharide deacetylase family protein [Wansuia hejianensis]
MDKKGKIIILILILCILISIGIGIKHSKDKSREVLSINLAHKDLGQIVSIIEYGEKSVIAAHYPIFGNSTIDDNTRLMIFEHIDKFDTLVGDISLEDKNYKAELNIDYEVYPKGKDIVSIKFLIEENLPYYAHPNITVETIVYNLKSEKELVLGDVMKGKYLERISKITREYFSINDTYAPYINSELFLKGTEPLKENYNNFLLTDDKIIFVFQKYEVFPGMLGVVSVEIPNEALDEFLKSSTNNPQSTEVFISDNRDYTIDLETTKVRNVDPSKPMVALTFDDGPYSKATIPILDTLKEHNSVATFFVLGNRVANHKDIIKRIVMEGSEIGNHSYNHKQLTTISSKEFKTQIDKTQNAVMEVIGSTPTIMRPTYGSYDDKLRSQATMPMILWSIDTEDWKSRDPQKIAKHVLDNVKDGDIVLMHDIFVTTAEAVEVIVPELINRGFQLVTISELYGIQGQVLEVGNIYRHNKNNP